MTAYLTRARLEAMFGRDEIARLADPSGAGEDRTGPAIEAASAEIEAALAAGQYPLPLPEGRYPFLEAIAVDLARERLYDDAPTEAVAARAREARRLAGQLRTGTKRLVSADGVPVERRPTAGLVGPRPAFTPESLAGL